MSNLTNFVEIDEIDSDSSLTDDQCIQLHLYSVKEKNVKKCYFLCQNCNIQAGKSLYVVFKILHKNP